MTGIIDIHEFFINNVKTELCSLVNNWTLYEKLLFQFRVFIYVRKRI